MKTNATKTNDEALNKFVGLVNEIRTLLGTLNELADEHFNLTPDEIHWGHVGDATETRNALQNILDRINGTGEYAL